MISLHMWMCICLPVHNPQIDGATGAQMTIPMDGDIFLEN